MGFLDRTTSWGNVMPIELRQVTAFVPCKRLKSAIAFYCDVLGFELRFKSERYALVDRDNVAIRLIEVDADVDLSQPAKQQEFYIDVNDIDGVYAQMAKRLLDLPEGRVRAPFVQDYGQREFHVADEDCTLVYFGEAANAKGLNAVL